MGEWADFLIGTKDYCFRSCRTMNDASQSNKHIFSMRRTSGTIGIVREWVARISRQQCLVAAIIIPLSYKFIPLFF
jgi:hypothetical protein